MLSKECRLARREIDELELGDRLAESASAHLSSCAACREFRAERTELRELVGSLEPVVAPADFEMRLRARIARDESSHLPEPLFARFLRTPALAAAALFVVIGGAAVWVTQRNDQANGPAVTHQQPSQQTSNVATATGNQSHTPADPVVPEENPNAGVDQLVASGPRKKPSRGPRSEDYYVRPANTISQTDQAFVNAPSQAVVFAEERGTKRKISLPPISFGSQGLVDNRVPVSYTGNSRIW